MRPLASGWSSTEFFIALGALVSKVLIVLFTLNVIHATDPDKVIQQVAEAVAAIGALWTVSHGSANYTNNRTALKAAAVQAAAASPPAPRVIAARAAR